MQVFQDAPDSISPSSSLTHAHMDHMCIKPHHHIFWNYCLPDPFLTTHTYRCAVSVDARRVMDGPVLLFSRPKLLQEQRCCCIIEFLQLHSGAIHVDFRTTLENAISLSSRMALQFRLYRLLGKIVFFHSSLQPLPRLHRCKSSERNSSVQSLLLAGNFLYNQQQPSIGDGEVANFRIFLEKKHNI